ncbi:MAG: hemolysin III family protein, partial [Firmicutes bacterium]|nr:hemolysin III family protein [Bacillota bacterium]
MDLKNAEEFDIDLETMKVKPTPQHKKNPKYTRGEEIFNYVTHIVGGGLGIIGLALGLIFAIIYELEPIGIVAVIIFGISMVVMYTMSSLYHG